MPGWPPPSSSFAPGSDQRGGTERTPPPGHRIVIQAAKQLQDAAPGSHHALQFVPKPPGASACHLPKGWDEITPQTVLADHPTSADQAGFGTKVLIRRLPGTEQYHWAR